MIGSLLVMRASLRFRQGMWKRVSRKGRRIRRRVLHRLYAYCLYVLREEVSVNVKRSMRRAECEGMRIKSKRKRRKEESSRVGIGRVGSMGGPSRESVSAGSIDPGG